MKTLSICILLRGGSGGGGGGGGGGLWGGGGGGGGASANYWGRGVKVGLRHAFPLPGYQDMFNCSRPSRYTPSLLMG